MDAHNQIHYIEFSAADFPATESFFSSVFGWSFQHWGDDYMSFENAGISGGFARADLKADASKGSALVILFSNDLEKTRDDVLSAGGRIKTDIFSFPGGRRFHFIEPSGNELAVWTEAGGDPV